MVAGGMMEQEAREGKVTAEEELQGEEEANFAMKNKTAPG